MKPAAVLITVAIFALIAGCKETPEGAGPSRLPGAATAASAGRAAPGWPPTNPSPEFRRAAAVLKPPPGEAMQGGTEEARAFMARMMGTLWPRSYELFGTLSDEQISRFVAEKEIRLPAQSLTRPQREALDNWLRAADEMLGRGRFRAELRKQGAAPDLANVDVGFGMKEGLVGVYFWIKPSGGGMEPIIRNDFASM